jgi:hypothetical protein
MTDNALTAEQKHEWAEKLAAWIIADISNPDTWVGYVNSSGHPFDLDKAKTFSDLHDQFDANMLFVDGQKALGYPDPDPVDGDGSNQDFAIENEAGDIVSRWLTARYNRLKDSVLHDAAVVSTEAGTVAEMRHLLFKLEDQQRAVAVILTPTGAEVPPVHLEGIGLVIDARPLPVRRGMHMGFIVVARREDVGDLKFSTHEVYTRDEGKTWIAVQGNYDMTLADAAADLEQRATRGA